MKLRGLVVLLMLLGLAQAQEVRFGVKLGFDFPQIVGAGLRVDYPDRGLRLMVGGFMGIYALETHGYYRFVVDESGSGGYAGLGVGLLFLDIRSQCTTLIPDLPPSSPEPFPSVPLPTACSGGNVYTQPVVSGLIGYEWVFGAGFRGFLEFRPTFQPSPPYGLRNLPILPMFGVGISYWF